MKIEEDTIKFRKMDRGPKEKQIANLKAKYRLNDEDANEVFEITCRIDEYLAKIDKLKKRGTKKSRDEIKMLKVFGLGKELSRAKEIFG